MKIMEIRPPALNLPAYDFRTRVVDGTACVYDPLRKKYVAATPEEWVRLHLIQALIEFRDFPRGLIKIEHSIRAHGRPRRCDAVIYDRDLRPRMIIECKAPDVKIDQSTFDQIAVYNVALRCEFLLVSNGREHYCCRVDFDRNAVEFIGDLPSYQDLIQTAD